MSQLPMYEFGTGILTREAGPVAPIRGATGGRAGEAQTVQNAIRQGQRDPGKLTNLVFYQRHPDLAGRKLRADETTLIGEWKAIRRSIVLPQLGSPGRRPATGGQASDDDVRFTLRMAQRPAPGLGITLEQLLVRHQAEAGGIPIEVLLAFIRFEAGGQLFNDATAGKLNPKTGRYSPKFFELGVFQTPAGAHGCTFHPSAGVGGASTAPPMPAGAPGCKPVKGGGMKCCRYAPPGPGVERSTFGRGWHAISGKYPTAATWTDPTMQVRVGLWDLRTAGEGIANEFRDLFPSRGSEWYVRMAVLHAFAVGAGWTRAFLRKYRAELLQRPEGQRWNFLRGKTAYLKDHGTSEFQAENVDKKMDLAARLRAARGGGQPVTHEVTPGRPAPAPAPPVAAPQLRAAIVRVANQELGRWNNGALKETDPRALPILHDYWARGVGQSYSQSQLGSKAFQKAHPWSAAFISFVMRQAGAGKAFRRSAAHAVYIAWARDNRRQNKPNSFKAYRVTEVAPQVGDLVCKSRDGSGATYDTVKPGMKTHCDIVVAVEPGRLVTVGGNVSNSVSRTHVPIDGRGFIQHPLYFAILRLDGGGAGPAVPPPTPQPQPGAGGTPALIRQETSAAGTTLYVNIDLGIVDAFGTPAAPMTGIFIPSGYKPGATADLILYLHGHKWPKERKLSIDQYWDPRRFSFRAYREGVAASGRNLILVAPTLGGRSEAGRLVAAGGLDTYLAQVLAAIAAYGPRRGGSAPTLGSLVLACHSGGGLPMRRLAGGGSAAAGRIREAWGFDCTYNHRHGAGFPGDDTFWADWARSHPNSRVYIYYIANSPTEGLAVSMKRQGGPNVIVTPSKEPHHDYVPIAYWRDRLQGLP